MKRGTLDSFVQYPQAKKPRPSDPSSSATDSEGRNGSQQDCIPQLEPSKHTTYPFPIPQLPPHVALALSEGPHADGREIKDQPDLDLLYFEPFVRKSVAQDLFHFLRESLFFYRVKYTIKRGAGPEIQINTPRFTTVFGVDTSCKFSPTGILLSSVSNEPVPSSRYPTCVPRPIPECLDSLRQITEVFTGTSYNFCLVNYYASGNDSISYHSDDERFLGSEPAIASFSFGARRDFLMKHKPSGNSNGTGPEVADREKHGLDKPLKLPLASGDMILMRGKTQANWLHSIPKRKGGEADHGRINITFRRALVKGGTENYYKYNVGTGGVYKWNGNEMQLLSQTS